MIGRVALLVVAFAAVVAAAGCGGNEDSPRPVVPAGLAELCNQTRTAVERLGEPKDVGAAVFRPWARLGRAFVADVRRLHGATVQQRRQLTQLADYFEGFYDNLAVGYDLFKAGKSTSIKSALERGYALLTSAERLARRMGAPECAVRPFEEV